MPAVQGKISCFAPWTTSSKQGTSIHISNRIIFVVIGILMVLIAGFKLLGIPADYTGYVDFVTNPGAMNGTEELSLRFFVFLCSYAPNGFNIIFFFLIYAILATSLKLTVFLNDSRLPLLSLLLYLPSYFLLHEYVQIRAAVAIGFFLLALNDHRRRNIVGYFSKALLAILFHWSSVIMLPLYFISKPFPRAFLVTLPLLGLSLHILPIVSIISTATPGDDMTVLQAYITMHSGHTAIVNVFNTITLFQLIFFLLFLKFSRQKFSKEKFSDPSFPLLEIYAISLFCFYTFSALELPVVAFRLNEYLNAVLFILIPLTATRIKSKVPFIIFSCTYYLIYSYHLLINTQILPGLFS